MPSAPPPPNERERLAALRDLEVLDTAAEPQFDALVDAASTIAGTPISLVSLVDESRQWFKAGVGLGDVRQTDRDAAFCAHTILDDGVTEVQDTLQDERFAENPLVVGDPKIRFYCGVPIRLESGVRVGSLCVIDRIPRTMSESQLTSLRHLAIAAASALEGRKATIELLRRTKQLQVSEAELAGANLGLSQANEDLRSFVRVASHDLKSPLLTVSRLAEWAVESIEEGDPAAACDHLELLTQRVGRMDRLLSDLREYATLGRTAAATESVDTWSLAERSFQWHEGSQSARLELAGERSTISTQVAPLEVVLRNLIGNAIKHRGSQDATIQVTTRVDPSGGSVTFTVADDGPGIDPKFHEAVFEPLRTLQSRDETEGSGLGLSIVKRTVEQAGGEITLESDGVSGATFELTWPLKRSASAEAIEAQP